jgi:carboxypeptidase Q
MSPHLRSLFTAALLLAPPVFAQPAAPAIEPAPSPETAMLQRIFSESLSRGQAYENLRALTSQHPGRLAGSKSLEGAIIWAQKTLTDLRIDRVFTQDVMVPHWERGASESVRVLPSSGAPTPLAALALGNSVATPAAGIAAEIIEVKSLAELETLGREKIAGKIVFFNRPMDPTSVSASRGYSGAGDQRGSGPITAAKFGALAALTRSLTHAHDDIPHTGATTFLPDGLNIPACALSTVAADRLSAALATDPQLRVEIKTHTSWYPDALSHNVIGEIRGSEFPDQIMIVGGHLDSWDIAPGAHDDGAGIVQAIEVLRLFKTLGLKPRHTLRAVLFTNEENGLRGATAYADLARKAGDKHILALESDNGGFQPRGFQLASSQFDAVARASRWNTLLQPFGLLTLVPGRGGADVAPLYLLGATTGEILPESQRYFDIHHTTADSIDQVNPRELQLGAASLAALVWLIDTQGL